MTQQQFHAQVNAVMQAQNATWQEAVQIVAERQARAELGTREVIPDA